ncbi:MAG: hypothetical protein VXX50_05690 [Candidatus Thermoplasmatota archaeon]|jgi:hypothetical protein|nr:hypothetical protein [Candidatus Thermoplasmatota archaeon]
MSDNDEEEYSIQDSGLKMDNSIDSETHDDVDPFEELGIGSRSITSAGQKDGSKGYDAFAELMNDDSEDDENTEINDREGVNDSEEGHSKSESIYVMLLQTVWVDGILDPAEVRLLSKKRAELNITFERHLELVDELIG